MDYSLEPEISGYFVSFDDASKVSEMDLLAFWGVKSISELLDSWDGELKVHLVYPNVTFCVDPCPRYEVQRKGENRKTIKVSNSI